MVLLKSTLVSWTVITFANCPSSLAFVPILLFIPYDDGSSGQTTVSKFL